MSYCVNCGVELDKSAKKCALCSSPVVNPFEQQNETESYSPYPENYVIPKGVRKRYAAFMASVVILIPNIIFAITNLLVPESGKWAVYIVSTSGLMWFLFLLPFLLKKMKPYFLLFLDTAAVSTYVYVFYSIYRQEGWFFGLAFPLILFIALIIGLMIKWLKKKRQDTIHIVIAILIEISVISIFADILFHRFYESQALISFSLIVAASCVALIIFFIFVLKNKRFRAWLSRKFFI